MSFCHESSSSKSSINFRGDIPASKASNIEQIKHRVLMPTLFRGKKDAVIRRFE